VTAAAGEGLRRPSDAPAGTSSSEIAKPAIGGAGQGAGGGRRFFAMAKKAKARSALLRPLQAIR